MKKFGALAGLALTLLIPAITGCGSAGLNSIAVTPATQTLGTIGENAQFTAIGTYRKGGNVPTTKDVTALVQWKSSDTNIATVNSSGLATAVAAGTTSITASMNGFSGLDVGTATVVVTSSTGGSGGSGGGNLLSLTIIPSSITVGNLQDTGQFLAIGTFSSAPTIRDLTNSPTLTWISAFPNDFPVNNTNGNMGATAGIVTAYASGSAVITAEATGSDGSIQTATATFNCPLVPPNPPATPGTCYPGSQSPSLLATLTVYNEGLNTTNWLIKAPSATGTPNVIDCGPGASPSKSICVASYPVGTAVTLTAPANGAAFGGWSSNCTNIGTITAAGPNSCTVTLTTNDTVGAIFN